MRTAWIKLSDFSLISDFFQSTASKNVFLKMNCLEHVSHSIMIIPDFQETKVVVQIFIYSFSQVTSLKMKMSPSFANQCN